MKAYLKNRLLLNVPRVQQRCSSCAKVVERSHRQRRESVVRNPCHRESVVAACRRDQKRRRSATTARQDRDQRSELVIKAYFGILSSKFLPTSSFSQRFGRFWRSVMIALSVLRSPPSGVGVLDARSRYTSRANSPEQIDHFQTCFTETAC